MSDETPTPTAAADAGGQAAPMVIAAQYIKDLSFENPMGAEAMSGLSEAPNVTIEVNTSTRHIQGNNHEVTLFMRGEAKASDRTIFIVELTYAGVVTLNNVPEEAVQPVLLIDATRHLFPFARAVLANVTRDGGFVPLMVNPIDFAAMYVQQHGMPEGVQNV
jgi:preprotein translocase subunit SecB